MARSASSRLQRPGVSRESAPTAASLLGLRLVGGSAERAENSLIHAVRAGVPYGAIATLANAVELEAGAIAPALRIAPRTLARRREANLLSPDESDRLARVARTFASTLALFETPAKAKSWLIAGNRALGGVTPLSLLDTDAGAAKVEEVIQRIRHGIVS